MDLEDNTPGAIADDAIDRTILRLCEVRGAEKSVCPSEVARALGPDEACWRALMPRVRARAAALAAAAKIECLQRGVAVDALTARGPIRLRLRRG